MYQTEIHSLGCGMLSSTFAGLSEAANVSADELSKALVTGEGTVSSGDVGGKALRMQFLHKQLELTSYEQNDAALMRTIPHKKVPNVAIEWTQFTGYGTEGDNFVTETGDDGNFGVSGGDDNFSRQVAKVKYMATKRVIGITTTLVQNVADPTQAAVKGATLEMIAKMNLNCYNADSTLSDNAFNGIRAQIKQWVNDHPEDSQIMYDCQNHPLDKDILEDIMARNAEIYGNATLALMSIAAKGDLVRSLFPSSRYGEGEMLARFGVNTNEFLSTNGPLRLLQDKMLRAGEPLVVDGKGVNGRPRTALTASPGALAFAASPFTAIAAVVPGAGNYYNNVNVNTDTSTLGTAPQVPSSDKGGNATNNLAAAAGNYYLVAPVYGGKEGVGWCAGCSAAGVIDTPMNITTTSTYKIVQLDIDLTTPCITGLGSTYSRKLVSFRVYSYNGTSAPTDPGQFSFLCSIGCPTSGDARGYDNGMFVPGADQAFIVTEAKNGAPGWFLAQLLPMLKRPLPHLPMADLFALLAFVTPILWVPRHHVYVRNIGKLAL